MVRRRTRPLLIGSGRREVVVAELLAADWAAANGFTGAPLVELEVGEAGDPAVDRLTWAAPDGKRAVLYRIKGGGHGWPGGPQYMPAFVIGRVARNLDATGILQDFALGAQAQPR
jgi:polyhydroxybutyrate depolymerase